MNKIFALLVVQGLFLLVGCDFLQMKKDERVSARKAVARANDTYLYQDDLIGIATEKTSREDSVGRVTAYINSWIRKQLLINEAMKKIDIDEAEVERKVLEYRYSLIGYEYQNYYISQNLNEKISEDEIQNYYKEHLDNFILKQNIVRGTFIKVAKEAPRISKIKEWMYSNKEKEVEELKSYCLRFSTAYHLSDSTWMEFDKLVVNSPLAEIPNKIQFLKTNPYYQTNDAEFLYFLRVDAYQISDNVSPLEFVREDVKNIILNKRKVELARELEEKVYENATLQKDFEVFTH